MFLIFILIQVNERKIRIGIENLLDDQFNGLMQNKS
jgi:hypothetical protein